MIAQKFPFDRALREFESWLRVEKNLSPRSRTAYLYDLGRLQLFLAPENSTFDVLDVSGEQLRAYVHLLREDAGIGPRTLARTLSSIRVFFGYLVETNRLEVNPAEVLEFPKLPQKLPVYLVETELRRLLGAPNAEEPPGLRDRAMLHLLSLAGLRLQELVGLNLSDLDFHGDSIKVMGKGSKERLLPMHPSVRGALEAWLKVRPDGPESRAVFLNRFGKRLSGRMVQKLVDRYATEVGINPNLLSPHKLRHTFATLLHGNDVDLVEIQSLLGHSSLATTQIYTHVQPDRLRDAVERLESLVDRPCDD
jgi:site-specific recombinase XerD